MQRVGQLLEHLAQQRLVTDLVDVEIAKQALVDHREHVAKPLVERFMKGDKLRCLENPPDEGHVGVHFDEATIWLVDVLAYNRLMYPHDFDLDRVVEEVLLFLA